jgi:hypothetical protein
MIRKHSGFAQDLPGAQVKNPALRKGSPLIDVVILEIGGHVFFEFLPHLVHRIEFRALFGQPVGPDIELSCHLAGGLCPMSRSLIQKQVDRPAGIAATQFKQEKLKIMLAQPTRAEEQPMAGFHVYGSIEHALGVAARNGHPGLHTPPGPGTTQWRKEAQNGFILGEDDSPGDAVA